MLFQIYFDQLKSMRMWVTNQNTLLWDNVLWLWWGHPMLTFMSTGLSTLVLLRPQKEVTVRDTIENTWKWRDLVMIYTLYVWILHEKLRLYATNTITQQTPTDIHASQPSRTREQSLLMDKIEWTNTFTNNISGFKFCQPKCEFAKVVPSLNA